MTGSRSMFFVVASLVTGATVASCGIIGFVGLIVPHAVRLIVGPDHRRLVPSAALAGAAFLVVADCLARSVLKDREIPIGVVTALSGGPLFLMLLRKHKTAWGIEMLSVANLHAGYGEKSALQDVTLTVAPDEFLGVLGPNGSGKTTLLRAMRGSLKPRRGYVQLYDRDVRTIDVRSLARTMAYLPQDLVIDLGFTVRELVLMGRSPHLSRFVRESAEDCRVAEEAMGLADVLPGRQTGHGPQRRRAAADVDCHVPSPAAEDFSA